MYPIRPVSLSTLLPHHVTCLCGQHYVQQSLIALPELGIHQSWVDTNMT